MEGMEAKKGKMEGRSMDSFDRQFAQSLRSAFIVVVKERKDEIEGSTQRVLPKRVLPRGRAISAQNQFVSSCGRVVMAITSMPKSVTDAVQRLVCANSVLLFITMRICVFVLIRKRGPSSRYVSRHRRMPSLPYPLSLHRPYGFNTKYGLEKTSGSRLCHTCSGETMNSHSWVDIHYKECMTCAKPFLNCYWMPPRKKGFADNITKKAVVCYACSLQHNTCQFCASSTEPGKLMHYPSAQLDSDLRFTKKTLDFGYYGGGGGQASSIYQNVQRSMSGRGKELFSDQPWDLGYAFS